MSDRDLTAEDLMELAEFTELPNGKWRACIEVRGQSRIAMLKLTLPEATRCMHALCTALAAQLNARRHEAGAAEALIRRILTEVPIRQSGAAA